MLCGKIIYKTQQEAIKAVKGSNSGSRKWRRAKQKKSYYCDDCQAWHTTTGKANVKTKKKRFAERKAKGGKLFHAKRQITKDHILHIQTPNQFKIK